MSRLFRYATLALVASLLAFSCANSLSLGATEAGQGQQAQQTQHANAGQQTGGQQAGTNNNTSSKDGVTALDSKANTGRYLNGVQGYEQASYQAPATYQAPTVYEQPQQSYTAPPSYQASSYSAPAAPSYSAPAAPSYSAPAAPSYSAPAPTSYSAPATTSYSAPVAATPTYAAPTYEQPIVQTYQQPSYSSNYSAPAYTPSYSNYSAPAAPASYPQAVTYTMGYQQPAYSNYSYSSLTTYAPAAQSYPTQSYQAPSYSAPNYTTTTSTYQAPQQTYSAPAPVYQQPQQQSYAAANYTTTSTYTPPATPTYQASSYSAPAVVYQQPQQQSYAASNYSTPSYSAPTYSAPTYSAPSYTQQSYAAPQQTYQAPAQPTYSNYSAPAYQAPATSYQQPQSYSASNYSAPSYPTSTYQTPVQTYQAPAPTYQAPAQTYQAPAQTYQAPAQTYQAPAQTYSAPAQTYSAPAQTYSAPAPTYQAPAPTYQAPTYEVQNYTTTTYSAPTYSQPQPTYQAQSYQPTQTYSQPQQPAYQAPSYQPQQPAYQPTQTYAQPQQPAYQPTQSYQPAVEPTPSYQQPQAYAAPVQSYAAPAQTYVQPQAQSYAAPVQSYQPQPTYQGTSAIHKRQLSDSLSGGGNSSSLVSAAGAGGSSNSSSSGSPANEFGAPGKQTIIDDFMSTSDSVVSATYVPAPAHLQQHANYTAKPALPLITHTSYVPLQHQQVQPIVYKQQQHQYLDTQPEFTQSWTDFPSPPGYLPVAYRNTNYPAQPQPQQYRQQAYGAVAGPTGPALGPQSIGFGYITWSGPINPQSFYVPVSPPYYYRYPPQAPSFHPGPPAVAAAAYRHQPLLVKFAGPKAGYGKRSLSGPDAAPYQLLVDHLAAASEKEVAFTNVSSIECPSKPSDYVCPQILSATKEELKKKLCDYETILSGSISLVPDMDKAQTRCGAMRVEKPIFKSEDESVELTNKMAVVFGKDCKLQSLIEAGKEEPEVHMLIKSPVPSSTKFILADGAQMDLLNASLITKDEIASILKECPKAS